MNYDKKLNEAYMEFIEKEGEKGPEEMSQRLIL